MVAVPVERRAADPETFHVAFLPAVAPGANLELSAQDVVGRWAEELQQCRVVLAQLECSAELATGVADWVRRHGRRDVRTVLDPAPARELPADALQLFDIITPNETELAEMGRMAGVEGGTVEDVARHLVDRGVGNVIVTLGAEGALWVSGDGSRSFAAPAVTAVDTTGAGDAFAGALAASLAQGAPLGDAIERGCRAGAFCSTRRGVFPGLPYHLP